MQGRGHTEIVVVITEALEGAAVQRWREIIDDAVATRPALLVIDLRHSPAIDAAAIVMLLQVHRELVCADGHLLVRGAVTRVRRMLALARVDHVLDVEGSAWHRSITDAGPWPQESR